MAWFIYTVEGFPGNKEQGREAEFARTKGHLIILSPETWTPLKARYEKVEQGLNLGLNDKAFVKKVRTAEEIAELLVERYGHTGLVATRSENEDERRVLERRARKTHQEWIRTVIQTWQDGRRDAIYGGGHGLRAPNLFEKYCFKRLNTAVPSDAELTAQVATVSGAVIPAPLPA